MKYAEDIMKFRNKLITANDDDFAGCGSLKNYSTAEEWMKHLAIMENEDTCPKGRVTLYDIGYCFLCFFYAFNIKSRSACACFGNNNILCLS